MLVVFVVGFIIYLYIEFGTDSAGLLHQLRLGRRCCVTEGGTIVDPVSVVDVFFMFWSRSLCIFSVWRRRSAWYLAEHVKIGSSTSAM